MMRALIVVESVFGNTPLVAEAVTRGLSATAHVEVRDVTDAPSQLPGGVDLLIVGGPTHAFGMSRPRTRAEAIPIRSLSGPTVNIGIREWLAALGEPRPGTLTATFDTRVNHPRAPGSAARAALRRLRRLGFVPLE